MLCVCGAGFPLLHAATRRGPVCTLGVLLESGKWVCCAEACAWGRKEGGWSKCGSQDCDQCREECDTLCE